MHLLKLFIVLVVVCICRTATAQIPNTWVQKASLPDTGRAGAFAFSIGNKGYLGGGFNNGWQTFLKDFWEYDPSTDTWTKKNDLPFGKRALGISFSCNGKGYVGLGQDTLWGGTLHSDLWEYDSSNDTWTQKANFPGLGRRDAVSFVIDTFAYVGTGLSTASNPLNDFWAYNTTTNTWIQKNNFIGTSRMGATAFASSTKGYIGLGNDFFQAWKNDWYEYNPTTDTWLQKNNFPGAARNSALGLNINGKLFLGGGGISSPNGVVDVDDFWQYFPYYDAWIMKTNIPYKLSATTPFSISDKGYFSTGYSSLIQGGYSKINLEYLADTLEYNGITQISNQLVAGLLIYPNPCIDKLLVISDKLLLNTVEITDMLGSVVIQQTNNSTTQQFQIDISNLSKGIYLIKITDTNTFSYTKKFIKQ